MQVRNVHDIQGYSYGQRQDLLPAVVNAVTDCGGWVLNRKTVSDTTLQFQLDAFADVGLFDGGDAEVLDGAANRVPLRVKDAFAWTDDDLGSNHDSPYRLRRVCKTFLKRRL